MTIASVAYWTEASIETVAAEWLRRLGFAAADLWALDLERIATSAVATHGGPVFWRALASIALIVGAAEWRAGSLRTSLVFWGSHVCTLVLLAIFVGYALRSWHPPLAEWLHSARDVGPSAGYFGCLALWCRTWPAALRRLAVPTIVFGLAAALAWTLLNSDASSASVAAALAHVIAFPVGWLLSRLVTPQNPTQEAPVHVSSTLAE